MKFEIRLFGKQHRFTVKDIDAEAEFWEEEPCGTGFADGDQVDVYRHYTVRFRLMAPHWYAADIFVDYGVKDGGSFRKTRIYRKDRCTTYPESPAYARTVPAAVLSEKGA